MANAIALSIRFSIIEEENTETMISLVAAIRVAVTTEVPVTPVAPPYTKMVIREAEIVLVREQAS